jgi:hypothetical protein
VEVEECVLENEEIDDYSKVELELANPASHEPRADSAQLQRIPNPYAEKNATSYR